MHDRLDRQHARSQQLLDERDAAQAQLQRAALDDVARQAQAQAPQPVAAETEHLVAAVALQTSRRERAEVDAESALRDNQRLHAELERLRDHARALGHELAAAERHLQALTDVDGSAANDCAAALKGRRILYVGGRPSSAPAIRDLVQR